MKASIPWFGASGASYYHSSHTFDFVWHQTPANFLFVRKLREGLWHPMHIGHTADLSKTMSSSNLIHEARMCGATHVHVMTVRDEPLYSDIVRGVIYRDLIAEHLPWVNPTESVTL